MGKKTWQVVLICVLVAVLVSNPVLGVYAADLVIGYQENFTPRDSSGDYLTYDCEMTEVFLVTAFALILGCTLTNTTAGTTGHDVVTSATESTGHLQTSVTPGEFPETPYNVQNKVSVEISAPPGTPPGKYTVELRAKGYDTNEAKQVITVNVIEPTLTSTATSTLTPTEVPTNTPAPSATVTLTLTNFPTNTHSPTPSLTVRAEELVTTETASEQALPKMTPWWAWTLFGIATLFLLGFALWLIFFRKNAPIPCWIWLLFGAAGLKVLGSLCYFLYMWFM